MANYFKNAATGLALLASTSALAPVTPAQAFQPSVEAPVVSRNLLAEYDAINKSIRNAETAPRKDPTPNTRTPLEKLKQASGGLAGVVVSGVVDSAASFISGRAEHEEKKAAEKDHSKYPNTSVFDEINPSLGYQSGEGAGINLGKINIGEGGVYIGDSDIKIGVTPIDGGLVPNGVAVEIQGSLDWAGSVLGNVFGPKSGGIGR